MESNTFEEWNSAWNPKTVIEMRRQRLSLELQHPSCVDGQAPRGLSRREPVRSQSKPFDPLGGSEPKHGRGLQVIQIKHMAVTSGDHQDYGSPGGETEHPYLSLPPSCDLCMSPDIMA